MPPLRWVATWGDADLLHGQDLGGPDVQVQYDTVRVASLYLVQHTFDRGWRDTRVKVN